MEMEVDGSLWNGGLQPQFYFFGSCSDPLVFASTRLALFKTNPTCNGFVQL